MLASEIVANIKNLKNGGKTSDDKSLSDIQLMYICDYYRAILIKNQLVKGQRINDACVQSLNPNKIILTQSSLERCQMYTQNIPQTVDGITNNHFTFVGTEKGKSYQRTTHNKSHWDSYSKYIGNLPKWYELGSVITVINHNKQVKLSIKGIFERPIEVIKFNGDLDEMNPLNFEYPIANTMVDSIIKMIADSEVKLSMIFPKDNLNDGKDGQ